MYWMYPGRWPEIRISPLIICAASMCLEWVRDMYSIELLVRPRYITWRPTSDPEGGGVNGRGEDIVGEMEEVLGLDVSVMKDIW